MDNLGLALSSVAGLGSLVCYILVLVAMFQRGQSGLAIVCLLLTLCCGIGALVVFIYGWVRAREWKLQNVMIVWTCAVILGIIGNALNPVQLQFLQQQFRVNIVDWPAG
jgi:hypothetical protein